MDIYVLNENFEPVGIIDNYSSMIWTVRYFLDGDFELYVSATQNAIDILREKYYLCRAKDISYEDQKVRYKHVMIIEKIQIKADSENGNFLTVTGRCLKSILKRRIIWQQTNLSGKVEQGIRQIITENIISPTIAARKISNFTLGTQLNLSDEMERQFTGDNLGETIESLCTTYGYGYDIDIIDGNFEFYLYVGVDRSYSQSTNPYVVFSDKFENLISSDYSYDMTNYKNVALVAGEGEGLNRKTKAVGTASGIYRYEKYVDARDMSTNDGQYTDAQYNNLLNNKGIESLAESPIVENFEGEVETRLTYEFGKDYFLGDIVQVRNEYGIEASPRVLEIIESDSEKGNSIIPTFSTLEV